MIFDAVNIPKQEMDKPMTNKKTEKILNYTLADS